MSLQIFIPSDYDSDEPPTVHCETDIYHPNIDTTDLEYDTTGCNVCLNLLDKGTWSRKFGLEGVIIGIVFLMYNPNLSDPLTPDFDSGLTMEDFEENVKKYMRGEDVDERTFSADFLENLQSYSGADTATGDCDKDIEPKANQKDDMKEQQLTEENDGDKVDLGKSEEHLSTRDSVTNTEKLDENQNGEHVQSAALIENNINSESDNDKLNTDTGACKNSERNLQENLLKQLEETGFQNENDSNDDNNGCTTITIDEDTVLVTCDQDQLRQEEIFEKQTVNENSSSDQVIEDQASGSRGISEKNCEAASDSYSAVHSIIEELVENTINIHSDEDKDCSFDNLPTLNLTANDNNVTGVDISNLGGHHALETDKITSDSVGATANGNEIQPVINKEASLGRYSYFRQKSRESVKTQANAFNNCVPYLKFVILHAFRCLSKL